MCIEKSTSRLTNCKSECRNNIIDVYQSTGRKRTLLDIAFNVAEYLDNIMFGLPLNAHERGQGKLSKYSLVKCRILCFVISLNAYSTRSQTCTYVKVQRREF